MGHIQVSPRDKESGLSPAIVAPIPCNASSQVTTLLNLEIQVTEEWMGSFNVHVHVQECSSFSDNWNQLTVIFEKGWGTPNNIRPR